MKDKIPKPRHPAFLLAIYTPPQNAIFFGIGNTERSVQSSYRYHASLLLVSKMAARPALVYATYVEYCSLLWVILNVTVID